MGQHGLAVWLGFTGLVVALLVLDLGVLNRRSHVLSFKEAMSWSLGLIALALLFGAFLWWREGSQHALEYYTGYLIELSLSVDNLFVFILIFNYFGVPAAGPAEGAQVGHPRRDRDAVHHDRRWARCCCSGSSGSSTSSAGS